MVKAYRCPVYDCGLIRITLSATSLHHIAIRFPGPEKQKSRLEGNDSVVDLVTLFISLATRPFVHPLGFSFDDASLLGLILRSRSKDPELQSSNDIGSGKYSEALFSVDVGINGTLVSLPGRISRSRPKDPGLQSGDDIGSGKYSEALSFMDVGINGTLVDL